MRTTRQTLIGALFCALLIVGAFIRVPLPPVPITLQTLFVLLLGLTCPWTLCLSVPVCYLFLGAIGLPVFTSGGGLGALFGPTGGFLLSWLVAPILCHAICRGIHARQVWWDILAVVAGTLVIYAVGVPYLKFSRSLTWAKAFAGGMFPFLAGDAIKAAVAVIVAPYLRKKITAFIGEN